MTIDGPRLVTLGFLSLILGAAPLFAVEPTQKALSGAIVMEKAEPAHPQTSLEISAADMSARAKALSEDYFEGRNPSSKNGESAADWIAAEMKRIGLKPGNKGSYFQKVPAVTIALDPAKSSLTIETPQGALNPKFLDDAVYWTPRFAGKDIKVTNAELIFVGYGVVAPEYNWNDYAGVDVKGKTVVILVNDPGNEAATPDSALFKGKAMTYYGRWTYKFEEAARQGAAAALIVHETKPAAYGWQVVRNSNSGAKLWLDAKDKNATHLPLQGWVTLETATELFKRAGLDYAEQKTAANKPGFKAVPLTGESLSANLHSTVSRFATRNVVGVLPGTKSPNDYILYTAHWDHLGIKPDITGDDKLHNGAIDNATGTSAILEIAEAFAQNKPQRSVAFLAWTLEEQGLLGSQYFAEHPIWPVAAIVGGINMDGMLPEGRARDMVVIGNGASELEDILTVALKGQSRTITPDPEPEKGSFYRSDHISLAKAGVPMLYPAGGYDLIDGGKTAGQAVRDAYRDKLYHQPSDEWSADWDLSGPIDDVKIYYSVGETLANSSQWPNWYKDNEFRAIRDKSLAAKRGA